MKARALVLLSEHGCFVWNNPTGVATPLGRSDTVRYGTPGAADIVGLLPDGRFLAVEIKTGSGRLSRVQKLWRARCLAVNGVYWVVRSLDQLGALLREHS